MFSVIVFICIFFGASYLGISYQLALLELIDQINKTEKSLLGGLARFQHKQLWPALDQSFRSIISAGTCMELKDKTTIESLQKAHVAYRNWKYSIYFFALLMLLQSAYAALTKH